MKSCFVVLLLAAAGCSTTNAIPSTAFQDLRNSALAAEVRLMIDADKGLVWIIAIEPDALPPAVRRASQAVLQEGEYRFIGRIHAASETTFLLEKQYPLLPGEHLRTAIIAADGRIISRSHSIPLADLPVAARSELQNRGKVQSLEFVEESDANYFRAKFADGQGNEQTIEIDAAGRMRRMFRILPMTANLAI